MSVLDVFLSYSRDDRTAAQKFAAALADEGLNVWWDAALRSGETFDEVIETALGEAKSVVVLWSPRSVGSRWVRAEATSADRRNKLISVMIETCDRPIMFELTHTTDLSHWNGSTDDRAWRSMIADVRRLVERGEPTRLPAQTSAAQISQAAAFGGNRSRATGHGPRKLDNHLFKRIEDVPPKRSPNRALISEGDDHTQFYTRGGAFLDQFHCLELTIGDRLEKRYVVSPPGLRIGRAAPADVILSDSRVSRSHCVVELKDAALLVRDLGSTNGTFVDDKRIDGSGVLPVGSVLKVGSVSFRHELRTSAEV